VATLIAALDSVERRRTLLVVATMMDKDNAELLPALVGASDRAWITRVQYYRGADPAELRGLVPAELQSRVQLSADVPTALDEARREAGPDDLIVVAGSVFLVGEARTHLLGEETDPVKVTDPVATR